MKDGAAHSGVMREQSALTLTLAQPGGALVKLDRKEIAKEQTHPVSAMPPFAALLGAQEVADITAWLLSQKPAGIVTAGITTPPQRDGFDFDLRNDRLVIAHSRQPVVQYVFRDAKILRPYFANLHAPGGVLVTRHHPPIEGHDTTDHADMHPGLWLGFGDISGTDFWRNQGRIEHLRFSEPPTVKEGRLIFVSESRLLTPDHKPLGSVVNRFSFQAITGAWLITWEAEFHATHGELIFGDQEEMGFGARVTTALAEKNGGLVTSSAGLKTAAKTWGQPAVWCDYSGGVGGLPCGVTLMASSANFRTCWWHNRDYGVFVANPFGRASMKQGGKDAVVVKPGASLRLRFGAAIHAGPKYDAAATFRTFSAN